MTNIAYRATADVVSKAVTLVITVAAARVLPAADFGVLALAMTTGWLLSVASDAGLPLFLARHMARRVATGVPASFAVVASVMGVRAGSAAAAALAGLGVALSISSGAAIGGFFVIVIAQLLNAVLETLSHAYRGIGRSDIESSVMLGQRTVTAVAALAVLALHPSLWWLSVALVIPPAVALLVSVRIARQLFAGPSDPDATLMTWPRFAREVGPVGAGILLSALYFRCDVYFVERWHGLEVVGVYNAAFRVVEALRLLPAALMAVAFPALCVAPNARLLKRLSVVLAGSSLAITALLYMTAPQLLGIVYGTRFVDAAPALQILAWAVPLFFVNYALTHQVIAWDGQRSYLAITATALSVNVVLNLLLIPTGGMTGAATSTLVTELVVMAGCLVALHRTAGAPALSAPSLSADLR